MFVAYVKNTVGTNPEAPSMGLLFLCALKNGLLYSV